MHVCLATLHPRILSGQVDSLAGLGRALVRRGHEVTPVAPFATDRLLDRSLIVLDDGPSSLARSAIRMIHAVPGIVAASREADVLHLALPTPAFSWVADVVRAFTPTPIVTSFEGHLAPAGQLLRPERLRDSWKSYLPLWGINNGLFGRLTAYSCQAYIVSSHYQARELVSLRAPAERIHIVSNVIEGSKLATCEPLAARAKLKLPSDRTILGYIGHFNDVKGVDLLSSAFASLAERHPGVHLALAWSGQGNPEPIRRGLAGLESRVTWLGKVHVGTFLCSVDALVLPYRSTAGQGAFPSLVLEAIHACCPLLTSDLPLIREIVLPNAALLFQPEQTDDLAAQMERLVTDDWLRATMADAQRAVARRRFAPDALAGRYEAIYQSLAAGEEQVPERETA